MMDCLATSELELRGGCVGFVGGVMLHSRMSELTLPELCGQLDLTLAWQVVFAQAVARVEFLGTLQRCRMRAAPLEGGKLRLLWMPPRAPPQQLALGVDDDWEELLALDDELEAEGSAASSSEEDVANLLDDEMASDRSVSPHSSRESSSSSTSSSSSSSSSTASDSVAEAVGPGAQQQVLAEAGEGGAQCVAANAADGDGAGGVEVGVARRDGETFIVSFDFGSLSWYRKGGMIYAYCDQGNHGGSKRCRLNRTCAAGTRSFQGRPCGVLLGWLQLHARHAGRDGHFTDRPSRADRVNAREILKATAEGRQLLSYERPKRPDEADSEPENYG